MNNPLYPQNNQNAANAAKKRRLGRGLEALLGNAGSPSSHEEEEPRILPLRTSSSGESQPGINGGRTEFSASKPVSTVEDEQHATGEMIYLNVYDIDDNPFQPRREFNEPEIAALAASLKEHDMLQPILVRKTDDRYQLISGERRLRAAIQAGWTKVPARIREADDRLVAELAIVENLQRKDLNPIEKALSFKRYLDEHDCLQEDLANRLKIDRSTIANLIRLLDLPALVQDSIRTGTVTAGHARALLPLGNSQQQVEFCSRIQREGWSVRETELKVQQQIDADEKSGESQATKSPKRKPVDPQIAALEQELRLALGTKIQIQANKRGKGKIVIHFQSNDEFIRIRRNLSDTFGPTDSRRVG